MSVRSGRAHGVRYFSRLSEVPEDAWAALRARPPASINGSRAWVAGTLASVDRGREPRLLAVEEDDRLVALLPLVVDRRRDPPTAQLAGSTFNDLTDVLVLPGHESAATAVVAQLREMADHGWGVVLDLLDPAGALAAADRDTRLLTWAVSECAPTVDLRGPWRSHASKRRRQQWDRSLRRLRARHRVEFTRLAGRDVLTALPEFVRIRELRLRDERHPLDLTSIPLLEAVAADLATAGSCECVELRVDGEVVASDIYLLDPPVALMWLRAMHPAWRGYCCGHLLLRATAEVLAEDGFDVLDLGVGAEPYKFFFGAEKRLLMRASAGPSC
jgi:CelD/BcsL family acetyltransferase involved in cellulose biosynthesis